jgi:hypothetical protein
MQQPNGQRSTARIPFLICRLRSVALLAGLVFLMMLAPGCTKSTGAIAVKGHVAYRNAPLNSGTLTFFPTTGRSVTAAISDGDYNTELMPGEYTVALNVAPELPPGFKEGDVPPPPTIVLPDQYTTRARSTLTASVKQGQDQPINFELK